MPNPRTMFATLPSMYSRIVMCSAPKARLFICIRICAGVPAKMCPSPTTSIFMLPPVPARDHRRLTARLHQHIAIDLLSAKELDARAAIQVRMPLQTVDGGQDPVVHLVDLARDRRRPTLEQRRVGAKADERVAGLGPPNTEPAGAAQVALVALAREQRAVHEEPHRRPAFAARSRSPVSKPSATYARRSAIRYSIAGSPRACSGVMA